MQLCNMVIISHHISAGCRVCCRTMTSLLLRWNLDKQPAASAVSMPCYTERDQLAAAEAVIILRVFLLAG
jgi:hypothetical protein